MVDMDQLQYTLNEISKSKGSPYYMANEVLADELFPFIQDTFSDAQMIKYDNSQCIVVSQRAMNKLKKQLATKIANQKSHLSELENALARLN